ncbi:DUF6261 family protein [Bacteroides sp. OttesenSCG-928-D19]|nr:DUF6261 family protein [Bacteroides sp. OttesenSCG-928-N06]MDL2303830.1 DUF6261 family protein [Bacteroides sp. OttesenSCG-928-D19]
MKNEIKRLALSRLSAPSHYEFHRTVLEDITQASPGLLNVDEVIPLYAQEVETLFKVINRRRSSALTGKIAEADRHRDGLIGEFFTIIDAAVTSRIAARRPPGKLLKEVIASFRGMAHNEITKETALLRVLIINLGTTQAIEAMQALGLETFPSELLEANNHLATLISNRGNEWAAQADINGIKTGPQRKLVDKLYRSIVQMIDARSVVFPSPELSEFIDRQNAVVGQYKRVLGRMEG